MLYYFTHFWVYGLWFYGMVIGNHSLGFGGLCVYCTLSYWGTCAMATYCFWWFLGLGGLWLGVGGWMDGVDPLGRMVRYGEILKDRRTTGTSLSFDH